MDKPLISVIVPVYNVERYLSRCIDSILTQTYENLEIILVDDGSTDSSGQICEDYADKDPRIKTIHKPNEGLADARNKGIEAATGAYCSFVDSDDYVAEDCIEDLYDMANANGAQIAVCGYQKVYEDISDGTPGENNTEKTIKVYNSIDALSALLYQRGIISAAWGRLFKREVFGTVRFPKGRQHEDVAVMYKLFDQAGVIAVGSEKKYYYLQRSGSIIHSTFHWQKMDYIMFTGECINYMRDTHPELVNAAVSRHFSACFEVLASISSGNDTDRSGRKNDQDQGTYQKACQKLVQEIKKHRKTVLYDRNARLVNRIAAIGSYISVTAIQKLCRLKCR